MSLSYMAAKLMRLEEEPRDIGVFAQELQGWSNLNGSASLFLLGLYRTLLVFLRKDLGAQSTNVITLLVAACFYGGFFMVGIFLFHLPLMLLAMAFWLIHLLLSIANLQILLRPQGQQIPPYSFGEPRPVFLLCFGHYFPRWHYCLFYEPAVTSIPLCLCLPLYIPFSLYPDIMVSPTPVVFFFASHILILFATSWWLFREHCELEVEMQTKRLEDEAMRDMYEQMYEEQRGSHARARKG